MSPIPFGQLPDGRVVHAWTLRNAAGASLQVITYGGIVTRLRVPDRAGRLADVVLGFDRLGPYLAGHPYFGVIAGRVAGRITGARFAVDGHEYPLAANDPPNHLHGGRVGFDKHLWSAGPVRRDDGADSVLLSRVSPDGEEGYPGAVRAAVTFTLTAANEFVFETDVTADRPTPVSLTHHSYFNLAGEGAGPVLDHVVQVPSAAYAPTDAAMTLLGRRVPTAGTGADLRHPRPLGEALPGLFGGHGDLYFLDRTSPGPVPAARVVEPTSGRVLDVRTTEDCVQFYTGASLDGSVVGKAGTAYGPHHGFCLECEGYPDGANVPTLGDVVLRPGERRRAVTVYAFSVVGQAAD